MATLIISGPVGDLEIAIQTPIGGVRALALVAHPHPLHGGTMDNKVTTTLARVCLAEGCAVVRFNCRGVGRSSGVFDNAKGETDDAACALAYLESHYADNHCAPLNAAMPSVGLSADLSVRALPVVLCGFSFGTAVVAQLAQRLAADRILAIILAGAAVQRFAVATVNPHISLLIHGQLDETVPLTETLAWAAPQALPVSVIPNADHFFNRQLVPLKLLAQRHLKSCLP